MANYSFNPGGRISPTSASSMKPVGNSTPTLFNKLNATVSQSISALRLKSPMIKAPEKGTMRASTALSPSLGGMYSEMFTDLIPNVNFNKITLTGGTRSAPLKVKLNLVLKDVVEGDSISDWFASSLDNDSTSSPFEKYLKVNIIQCTHPDVCEVLSGRQTNAWLLDKGISSQAARTHIENRSINLDTKINAPVDNSKGIKEYRRIMPGGEEVIEIPFEETFKVFTKAVGGDTEHLSYFVWITMDVAKMANDFDMSEAFFAMAAPATSVYSEYIIQNGSIMTDTKVFLLPSGEVWEGEVHYHDPAVNPVATNKSFKGYMTGKRHTPDSQFLEVKTVSNKKIRDYRYVNRVEDRYRSVTQARIGAGLAAGEAEIGEAVEEDIISDSVAQYTKLLGKEFKVDKASSAFTDLWTSLDEAHNGNGMFGIDYVSLLKNNSAYPYLWSISEETTLKLLSYSKIISMRLMRRQVNPNTKSNNKLGTPDRPIALTKGYSILASTSQQSRKRVVSTVNDSKCYFTETKVDLHGTRSDRADGVRWFTFTDKTLFDQGLGTYQYSISLKTLDPTSLMLTGNLRRLHRARHRLNQYLQMSQSYTKNKPNFDIYVDRFIPEFITNMYRSSNHRHWKTPSEDYLKVLKEVSNVLQQPAYPGSSYTLETILPATLSSYLDPHKGSPEGIQTVIGMVDAMINELQDKVGNLELGATRQARKSTSGVPSPRDRSTRTIRTIEENYVFGCGQEIVIDGQRGKGYDYITNQTLDFLKDNIKGKGLRTLTSRYYRKRCEIETKRYFTIASKNDGSHANFDLHDILGTTNPDIRLSSENGNDSLVNQKFTYLTPSFVFQSFPTAIGTFGGAGGFTIPPSAGSVGANTSGDLSSGGGDYVGWQLDNPGSGGSAVGSSSTMYGTSPKNQIGAANLLKINTKNLVPVTVPKNEQQEPPTGLDEVQANVIAAQADADFSLFPISVKGYAPPNQSRLSPQEQALKKQYMELLATRCQVVNARLEFDLANNLRSKNNPNTFEIDDSNPSDESINEPTGPDYENIDHAEDVGAKKLLPLKKIQPLIPKLIQHVNPVSLLKVLGNASFGYFGGGPSGPISYRSVHLSNFQLLNFADTDTPSVLDGVNPSLQIKTIKALPNQLKSLALATSDLVLMNPFRSPSRKTRSEGAPPTDETPWFFKPENMSKIWQMFQNIVSIEYLYSFQTPVMEVADSRGNLRKSRGQRDLLKSPMWLPLDRDVINKLEDGRKKVSLLCKIKKYRNSQLGIGYGTKRDMPIIDEYFTMVIDPFADPDLGRIEAVEDGDLDGEVGIQISTNSTMGNGSNSNLISTDSSNILSLFDKGYIRIDELGEEITVQEFDGNLVVSSNCDDGGT